MHTSIPAQGNALGISEHRFPRSEGTPHREGTAIMSCPPGMGKGKHGTKSEPRALPFWYVVSRWDMATPQRGGCIPDRGATPENMAPSMRCSVGTRGILRSWLHLPRGWETRALPFASMRCPVGTWLRPKGAAAYQPGVQPREQMAPNPCVLKERRIGREPPS